MTSAAIYFLLLLGVFVEVTRSMCYTSRDESGDVDLNCKSSRYGNSVLKFNRAKNELKLQCEIGVYSFQMMSRARSMYMKRSAKPMLVDCLEVEGCSRGKPLACVLRAMNGTDVKKLMLRKTSAYVEGLESLQEVEMCYDVKGPDQLYLQLTNLEISNGDLEVLPARGFNSTPNVKTLLLYGNHIGVINKDAFKGLSKLELLDLNRNEISYLPPMVFHHCRSLKHLIMSLNKLERLYRDLFAHLTELEEVEISRNSVEMVIENDTFANLTSLKILTMEGSRINLLPVNLFRGSPLEILKLRRNNISELLAGIFSGVKLKILDLSGNKIEHLPGDVFDSQVALDTLDLSGNCIRIAFAGVFSGLAKLTSLNLSNNKLEHLESQSFDGLHSLTSLDFSHNLLTTLSLSTFDVLRPLQSDDMAWSSSVTIDLSHNNITNITPHVFLETWLPYFILNGNSFSCDCTLYRFIKAHIGNESIGILREDDLICSSPPVLAGRSFSNIKELRCSTCPSNCSCGIRISPTTTVYELNCSSVPLPFPSNFDLPIQLVLNSIPNKISNLPPSVKHLIMSNLSMTGLPHIDTCSEVDLRHNLLTEAPFKLLEANCRMKLAHNPFKCDCDYQQTFKKYENQIIDFSEVTCDGGLTIQNHLVEELCVTKNAILLGVGVSAGLLSLGACVILIYINRTLIRLYLIRYGLYHPGQVGRRDTMYDAFVSYEVEDERYVFHQLIPKLESGRCPLRLCIPCRDWEVGGMISEQISQSVQGSRVTIVVLSTRYGKSTWRNIEFRTAQALQRIIVLLMDDVAHRCSELGLNTYTSMNKCIKASDTMAMYKIKQAVGEG